jgi:hypothetical protein
MEDRMSNNGFGILFQAPMPPSSDIDRMDKLNDSFIRAFGKEPLIAPEGYSGRVPPGSLAEKRAWIKCLRENGMNRREDGGIVFGEF